VRPSLVWSEMAHQKWKAFMLAVTMELWIHPTTVKALLMVPL